jgi:hypothetical protein
MSSTPTICSRPECQTTAGCQCGSQVIAWPLPAGTPKPLPKRIARPCDWGLVNAMTNLEIQLGTIEAYNRLVWAAEMLKAKIDRGGAQPQNPIFARSIKGASI